jgi:MFS family permease
MTQQSAPATTSLLTPFGLCVIYGLSIFSMAFIGTLVPLANQLANRLGVDSSMVGGAIALCSAPSALLSFFSGGMVEKIGTRNAVAAGGVLVLIGDAIGYLARTILIFDGACLVAGVGFMIIITAAPAFIVQTSLGSFRTRSLSIWSTYAPVGFSAGLLMAAPFSSGADGSTVLIVHAVVMAILVLAAPLLPKDGEAPAPSEADRSSRPRLKAFFSVLFDLELLRLGLAYSIICGVAYGTGLVATPYLANTYHISMGRSATAVAAVKIISMLVAGFGAGELLTHKNPRMLFVGAVLVGITAQFALFWPGSGFWMASAGLGAWLLSYGCLTSISMALLPAFLRKSARPAMGSGLVSQLTSIASFLGAQIYFSLQGWHNFVIIMLVCLAAAASLMPLWYSGYARAQRSQPVGASLPLEEVC